MGCWPEQGGNGGGTKQCFLKKDQREGGKLFPICASRASEEVWWKYLWVGQGWKSEGSKGGNSWSASGMRKSQKSAENLDLLGRICMDLWVVELKTISETLCLSSPLEQGKMEERSVPRPSFM